MALTTTTIKWTGANADITIDGTIYSNVASPYIVELPQGDHTCKIVQGNKTIYEDTLHVPKALADKVEEEIQSRNLVTQDQMQTQIETALEASQGYIDIVEVKDESIYNTGQNGKSTFTQWKLYYKVVQPEGGSVPVKIKTIDTDDHATTVDVDFDATNKALLVYDPPVGGAPQNTIKEIQILAGNNRVIDKLDLSMLVTETDAPNILYDKSSIEKIIVPSEASFKIKPLKSEFKKYRIVGRSGQLGGGSIVDIDSDDIANGISIDPNTVNNIEFRNEANKVLYKYYIDDDIKVVGLTNNGDAIHIVGISGQTPVYVVYEDGNAVERKWGVNMEYVSHVIDTARDYMITLNSVTASKNDGRLFYYSTTGANLEWN
jgi:hypothetical protein